MIRNSRARTADAPMSVSQAAGVWFQIHSGLNEPGGMMLLKFTVAAVAANPHRAGVR